MHKLTLTISLQSLLLMAALTSSSLGLGHSSLLPIIPCTLAKCSTSPCIVLIFKSAGSSRTTEVLNTGYKSHKYSFT